LIFSSWYPGHYIRVLLTKAHGIDVSIDISADGTAVCHLSTILRLVDAQPSSRAAIDWLLQQGFTPNPGTLAAGLCKQQLIHHPAAQCHEAYRLTASRGETGVRRRRACFARSARLSQLNDSSRIMDITAAPSHYCLKHPEGRSLHITSMSENAGHRLTVA
jgi:hypothetical protein